MAKKGHAVIPDFSHKKPVKPGAPAAANQKSAAPKAKPISKPQATSQKSGRRGQ
jgi:hypothetical protein